MPELQPIPTMPERSHGTRGGYDYWGCRCEPCREANRVGRQDWEARVRADLKSPKSTPRRLKVRE